MTGDNTAATPPWADDPWRMEGSEGTGEYRVIGVGPAARIGIRPLEGGYVRIRIEPASGPAAVRLGKAFTSSKGWKQPNCVHPREFRYSMVVDANDSGVEVVLEAIKAIVRDGGVLNRSSKTRLWRSLFKGTAQEPPMSAARAKQLREAVAAAL